jgi:hypothetical protein
MLEHPGHDNAPRWKEGERLHHLFEERCDALGDAGAVATSTRGRTGSRVISSRAASSPATASR